MTEKLPPGPCSGWEEPGKAKLSAHSTVGLAQAECSGWRGTEKPLSSLSIGVEIEGISRKAFQIIQTWAGSRAPRGSRFASFGP